MSWPADFLDVDDVLLMHNDTIRHEGGLDGLRDSGLLQPAVAMPRQRFGGQWLHEDLAAMAGAYLYHLAMNHAFLDGNKRVAAMSCLVFLAGNGIKSLPSSPELTEVTLAVASGGMNKTDLISWLRQRIKSD